MSPVLTRLDNKKHVSGIRMSHEQGCFRCTNTLEQASTYSHTTIVMINRISKGYNKIHNNNNNNNNDNNNNNNNNNIHNEFTAANNSPQHSLRRYLVQIWQWQKIRYTPNIGNPWSAANSWAQT